MRNLNQFLVTLDTTISATIACIDQNTKGIALVVDEERHLLGTVTDGDIRRALLCSTSLDASVKVIFDRKVESAYPKPLSAPLGTQHPELLRIMHKYHIRHLPIVNNEGRVVSLVTLDDLMPEDVLPVQAVIMAGGYGKRLRPLTKDMPKPMLPVGNQPLMEHIISQLRVAGIQQLNVSTNFMADKIEAYFGDGKEFGVNIEYVSEDRPLGTAGALSLLETPDQPVLVINGDILTDVNFRAMLDFHNENHADMTVGVRQYDLQVPYGVIETEGVQITRIREKPLYTFFVNAGIYLFNPRVHGMIPSGERYDMTDLIDRLITEGHTVASFPIIEYWLDIGKHTDYDKAQQDIKNGRFKS